MVKAPPGPLRSKPQVGSSYYSSVWTFDRERESPAYRWYGTLPEGLIHRLFDLYVTKPGATVLDPFVGSGTTLAVAQSRGIMAMGLDVNPLSVLISEERLAGEPDGIQQAFDRLLRRVRNPRFRQGALAALDTAVQVPEFEYSRRWFGSASLERLWVTGAAISREEDGDVQRALFVALAAAVKEVANIDPRCTHHLVTKVKPYIDCLPFMAQRVLRRAESRAHQAGASRVAQGDALSPAVPGGHALALVHPPYLGVINYHWIHRPATDLLGLLAGYYSPVSLSGLDFNYAKLRLADMSSDRSDRYESYVARLAEAMARCVDTGGRTALIVGDQRYRGLLRHSFVTFVSQFERAGFALEESFIWVLQNNGGMHTLRRGNFIDHNYVLIMRRQP